MTFTFLTPLHQFKEYDMVTTDPNPEGACQSRRLLVIGSEVISEELQAGSWREVKRVSTTDFLARLNDKLSSELVFLPLPCPFVTGKLSMADPDQPPLGWVRCFQRQGNTLAYLFEQPPQIRPLTVQLTRQGRLARSSGQATLLDLAFPWVILVFRVQDKGYSLYCYFRQKPLATADDILLEPALPNINVGMRNRVCIDLNGLPVQPHHQLLLAAVKHFWQAEFTSDYQAHYLLARGSSPRLASFLDWKQASQADPNFITSIPFPPVKVTAKELLTVRTALAVITTRAR